MRINRTITIISQPHTIELITTLINQWKPKLALFMGGSLTFELQGNQLRLITNQRKFTSVEWAMRINFQKKQPVINTVWAEGFEEFLRLFQIDLEKPVTFVDEPEEVEDEDTESEEDEPDEEP